MGKWLTCLPRLSLAQLRLTLLPTTASTCRRDLEHFPTPRWEFLLTCPIDSHLSIGIDLWFYQGGVRASHACKLPIAPMGRWLTCPNRLSSNREYMYVPDTPANFHRPHGKLTICSLFAGRRCQGPGWHSGHIIVHHQWEHSLRSERTCSKFPIAPMGRWLTCLNRLSSFDSDQYLVLSGICKCHPRLQTSHRPDGKMPC